MPPETSVEQRLKMPTPEFRQTFVADVGREPTEREIATFEANQAGFQQVQELPPVPPPPQNGTTFVSSERAREQVMAGEELMLETQRVAEQAREQVVTKKQQIQQTLEQESVQLQQQLSDVPKQVSQQFTSINTGIDEDFKLVSGLLDQMSERATESMRRQITSIEASMDQRRKQVKEIGQRQIAGLTIAGIRAGRQQYAPEIQIGILSAAEQSVIDNLVELDIQEQRLITEAQSANEEKQFSIMAQRIADIKEIRQEKTQLFFQQQQMAREQEGVIREQLQLVRQAAQEDLRLSFEQANFDIGVQKLIEDSARTARAEGREIEAIEFERALADADEERASAQLKFQERQIIIGEAAQRLDEQKESFDQQLDLAKLDLEIEKSRLEGAGIELNGEQLKTAIEKGYKTDAQLKLYQRQIADGIEPAEIEKRSAEERKLEGRVMSAVNAIQILRDKIKNETGKGKFLDTVYKASEGSLIEDIAFLKTGAAFSDEQLKNFKAMIPKFLQTEKSALQNLDTLEKMFVEVIGLNRYQNRREEIFVDLDTFERFGSLDDTTEFNDFLRDMGANETDNVEEFFEEYKKRKGLSHQMPIFDDAKIEKLSLGRTHLRNVGTGTVTGFGSSAWKWGLDFVLDKGLGALVQSPFGGIVTKVVRGFSNRTGKPLAQNTGQKQNDGFGNQVKIKRDDGTEVWISHLDSVTSLSEGQKIARGDEIGTQGNTGLTLGDTGVHLDITMRQNNKFVEPKKIAVILGDQRLFS
jgi:murein DD-endopeptidase MepM/ murein hydrolase activator NlpD